MNRLTRPFAQSTPKTPHPYQNNPNQNIAKALVHPNTYAHNPEIWHVIVKYNNIYEINRCTPPHPTTHKTESNAC